MPVPVLIGQHVGQSIAAKVAVEIGGYVERNHLPPNEVHVNITTYKNRDRVAIELTHQQNGTRIIGTPTRKFRIEWRVK